MNSVGVLVSSIVAVMVRPFFSPSFSNPVSLMTSPLFKVVRPSLVFVVTFPCGTFSISLACHRICLGGFRSGTKHIVFSRLLWCPTCALVFNLDWGALGRFVLIWGAALVCVCLSLAMQAAIRSQKTGGYSHSCPVANDHRPVTRSCMGPQAACVCFPSHPFSSDWNICGLLVSMPVLFLRWDPCMHMSMCRRISLNLAMALFMGGSCHIHDLLGFSTVKGTGGVCKQHHIMMSMQNW